MREILKVIVGSQAHGLATPESDFDYRGVFLEPTTEILKLGGHVTNTKWIEGKEDNTSWELSHFLHLATKCNPTILEVFLAPTVGPYPSEGEELRSLFKHVWNSKAVRDAFVGYGMNQRKKFLEDKDSRPSKYAAAYARTLFNAWELLTTGRFNVRIADTEVGHVVRAFKNGDYTYGEVIDFCREWERMVDQAYKDNPKKETNLEPINEFLLKIRKKNWV